jgi:hypothetical protein
MEKKSPQLCQIEGCSNRIVPALSSRVLCLDHFLDQAFDHASAALAASDQSLPVEPRTLEWLLDDAQIAAQFLSSRDDPREIPARDRILEFLLCVANLHEYAARYPGRDSGVN